MSHNMSIELHNSHFQLFMFLTLVAISNLHSDVKKVCEKDRFVAPDLLQKLLNYFR